MTSCGYKENSFLAVASLDQEVSGLICVEIFDTTQKMKESKVAVTTPAPTEGTNGPSPSPKPDATVTAPNERDQIEGTGIRMRVELPKIEAPPVPEAPTVKCEYHKPAEKKVTKEKDH